MGIVSVPALLQSRPSEPLELLHLERYEVSPIEPLHDIKGHFSNVIEESILIAPERLKKELEKIKAAVLKKDTIRGCDYRKAIILMYLKIRELQSQYYVKYFKLQCSFLRYYMQASQNVHQKLCSICTIQHFIMHICVLSYLWHQHH